MLKGVVKMTWKYKQAYELLWAFISCHLWDDLDAEKKQYLSDELDEIFGEKRKC